MKKIVTQPSCDRCDGRMIFRSTHNALRGVEHQISECEICYATKTFDVRTAFADRILLGWVESSLRAPK